MFRVTQQYSMLGSAIGQGVGHPSVRGLGVNLVHYNDRRIIANVEIMCCPI